MPTMLTRRTVLRGLGAAVSLPFLESLRAFGADRKPPSSFPLRTAFLYVPNGVNQDHWGPKKLGADWEFTSILKPLAPVRDRVLILSGLTHDKARANGDGAGDHARSSAAFLTGCQPRKTDGKDLQAGVSLDQFAAEKIGGDTRLPSLELGCDRGALAGNCDSGYSCAYSSSISWRSPSSPVGKEVNPRAVFERLFGDPNRIAADRDRARETAAARSILDFVEEDAKRLAGRLGGADRAKLDEYLGSVRAIEKRIQAAERPDAKRDGPPPGTPVPDGVPGDYREHLALMLDLIVLAFRTDSTRVVTMMFANEGSNRTFPFIDVREGHHSLSHHGGDADKLEKIRKIDVFYAEQLAAFLGKLKEVKEGGATLLDHCQIVYASAIGDGNRHNHDELPVILAGKANGTLLPGRHVRYPKNTPMCNLYLSMLDRLGVKAERFGDSTGRLPDLA